MGEQPRRIRRSRVKAWRMPENTVYVGRGSRWGNPHKVGVSLTENGDGRLRYMTAQDAVSAFRETVSYWTQTERGSARWPLEDLRGKNLACWCPLSWPCHADVLLELANSDTEAEAVTPQPGGQD